MARVLKPPAAPVIAPGERAVFLAGSIEMVRIFSGWDDWSIASFALRSRLVRICMTLCLSVVMTGRAW